MTEVFRGSRPQSLGKLLALSSAVLMVTGGRTARADANIYRQILPSTALVITEKARGSGVLVDVRRRLLVTNEHVLDDGSPFVVFFPQFKDGKVIAEQQHYQDNADRLAIRGRILVADAKRDLALVELESVPKGATAVPISDGASPGETVHGIGNPGAGDAVPEQPRRQRRAGRQ